jgi:hypothetical protein
MSITKYRYRVSLPPIYREDEEAIDASDIREILNHCDNKRQIQLKNSKLQVFM